MTNNKVSSNDNDNTHIANMRGAELMTSDDDNVLTEFKRWFYSK
jgi:hypothetical protein